MSTEYEALARLGKTIVVLTNGSAWSTSEDSCVLVPDLTDIGKVFVGGERISIDNLVNRWKEPTVYWVLQDEEGNFFVECMCTQSHPNIDDAKVFNSYEEACERRNHLNLRPRNEQLYHVAHWVPTLNGAPNN